MVKPDTVRRAPGGEDLKYLEMLGQLTPEEQQLLDTDKKAKLDEDGLPVTESLPKKDENDDDSDSRDDSAPLVARLGAVLLFVSFAGTLGCPQTANRVDKADSATVAGKTEGKAEAKSGEKTGTEKAKDAKADGESKKEGDSGGKEGKAEAKEDKKAK